MSTGPMSMCSSTREWRSRIVTPLGREQRDRHGRGDRSRSLVGVLTPSAEDVAGSALFIRFQTRPAAGPCDIPARLTSGGAGANDCRVRRSRSRGVASRPTTRAPGRATIHGCRAMESTGVSGATR